MKIMFKFLNPYRVAVAIALALMLFELGVELMQPLIIAKIIDDGILQNDLAVVLRWGGVLLGFSVFAFACGIINSFYASHVSQSFGFDVRKSLFNKIQDFSFFNFHSFQTSSLITRLTNDVTQVQNTVFMILRIMLRAPLLVVGGVLMAFFVHVQLAFLLAIVVPVLFLFLLWVMKKGGRMFNEVQKRLDSVNNVMQENLTGMRLIKAFLRRNHEITRFSDSNEELKDQTVGALRIMETTMPVLLLVMNVSVLSILWFGRVHITAGDAQVGQVVAVVNYAFRITSALSIMSFIIMAFSRARASSARMAEVLETDIDLLNGSNLESSSRIQGGIEYSNVSFQYPESGGNVLEELTFTVPAGSSAAVIGATGSGKSTLFQLIPRLYDTTEGEVRIDGKNVRDLPVKQLRKQIGLVPQEAMLFTGTIKENILWGKEDASQEEIEEAARHAQIHSTIMRLPKQYETVIGQKGVNLSGGQKQRISIARALIRKPAILLLDDSTSALDLQTEALLLENLESYRSTLVIITQKISTAMKMDQILLIEDGRVTANGTHEELLRESTLYQELYSTQFGEEEEHA
ncbi:ATP-binding cassette domain-containing protein [Bacillus lacus]|uniref:ATP-binding cassette domain-containing protein n=1 Tax=Metabacillus lacus TaxID=1983721 RepID=A0A7X2LYK7_9BACI|nr:ABC transporter ATP-binding protein [Metabacillus lacus]MRX72456.1 ATP-binding cassette domain-containing protein [Metabacillus lacus]